MRRRTKILGSITIIAALILVGWLVLPGKSAGPAVSLLIVTNAPKGDHNFFTAFLTNNTASDVLLDPPYVQLEEQQGKVVTSMGEIWVGRDGKQVFAMPSRAIVTVSPHADSEYRRVRFVVEYRYDARGFRRLVSRALRGHPQKLLPRNLRGWFYSHGFLDGRLIGRIESSWMPNPSFQQTPSRPTVPIPMPGSPVPLNSH